MKTGFFEEENGNRSSMRLMSFISLFASIILAAHRRFSRIRLRRGLSRERAYPYRTFPDRCLRAESFTKACRAKNGQTTARCDKGGPMIWLTVLHKALPYPIAGALYAIPKVRK